MVSLTRHTNLNNLRAGDVCEEHYQMLIELSKIRSEKVTEALREHFVNGRAWSEIYEKYDITPWRLSRKTAELQSLSEKIIALYPYYLSCLSKKIN